MYVAKFPTLRSVRLGQRKAEGKVDSTFVILFNVRIHMHTVHIITFTRRLCDSLNNSLYRQIKVGWP